MAVALLNSNPRPSTKPVRLTSACPLVVEVTIRLPYRLKQCTSTALLFHSAVVPSAPCRRARGNVMSVLPNVPANVLVRRPLRYPRTGATGGSVSPPVFRPYRGRCRAVLSSEWISASIQSRTRSRTPVSIGSIQSSKSRDVGETSGCGDDGFFQRRTKAADALIASAYLSGTNTRRVRRALAAMFGGAVSKDTVSRVWRKVQTDWDARNTRSLKDEPVVRLILDGTVVRVRLDKKATAISLLVVIGVRDDGHKLLPRRPGERFWTTSRNAAFAVLSS